MRARENHTSFLDILSNTELVALFERYDIEDIREQKLPEYHFFG